MQEFLVSKPLLWPIIKWTVLENIEKPNLYLFKIHIEIDYRLAPQNQFPAALQDALAAYLYLLNPPKDAGFEPLNPKNIVISGDSAGGGLSMALGLALRDAGLPSCAGIVGLVRKNSSVHYLI